MVDEILTMMKTLRGKSVSIKLRNGRILRGILREFDMHMNLTLDSAEDASSPDDQEPTQIGSTLLRGDNILIISVPDADVAAAAAKTQ